MGVEASEKCDTMATASAYPGAPGVELWAAAAGALVASRRDVWSDVCTIDTGCSFTEQQSQSL